MQWKVTASILRSCISREITVLTQIDRSQYTAPITTVLTSAAPSHMRHVNLTVMLRKDKKPKLGS